MISSLIASRMPTRYRAIILFFPIIFLSIFFAVWENPAHAQESDILSVQKEMEAIIDGGNTVEINKKTLFDASRSINPDSDTTLTYSWDMGDGTKAKGKEIVHTYQSFGEYTVKLFISNGVRDATASMTVFVYSKQYVLLLDSTEKKQSLESFLKESRNKGVSFLLISPDENTVSPSNEYYVEALLTSAEKLKGISTYIVWVDELRGLEILSAFARQIKNQSDFSLKDTTIVFITPYDLGLMYRVAGRSLRVINPRQIIVVMKDILGPLYGLMLVPTEDEWFRYIVNNTSAVVLDKKTSEGTIWNIFSNMINNAIQNGISGDIITFLLVIPLIAFIITFLKQVVGLSTSGVYTPVVLTLSMYLLGWVASLLVLGVIVIASILIKFIIHHIRLHYIPRVALIISFISIMLLFLIIGMSGMSSSYGLDNILPVRTVVHIFPVIVLVFMVEKFITAHVDSGLSKALIVLFEMVFISLIAYFIISNPMVQLWMFAYPELVLVWLLLQVVLGRFTGLRLLEYFRFRSILFRSEEE